MSSPILHYQFNDSDLGADSSDSGLDLTNNGVSLVTDSELGPVASFSNGDSLVLLSSSLPLSITGSGTRSFMLWVKRTAFGSGANPVMWYYGANSTNNRFLGLIDSDRWSSDIWPGRLSGTTDIAYDTWYHVATTYSGGVTKVYVDGTLEGTRTATLDTSSSNLTIGKSGTNDTQNFVGLLSNFRVYDTELSATEILEAYENDFATLDGTPWSTLVDLSWSPKSFTSSYRITQEVASGGEITSVDATTSTTSIVYNLTPSTTYTFRLYRSTDDVNYTLDRSEDVTTLDDTPANSNMSIFLTNGVYNFSQLEETTQEILKNHIDEILVTGDSIIIDNDEFDNQAFFAVARGTTSEIPDSKPILLLFNPSKGSSQSATLELSDATNVIITYDDSVNSIVVDGITRFVGETFILDGKKVSVHDV
ncbi:putative LamG-like jellyroll protein [Feldmannia species virus]|uniref:Putative LamG-like jellyroll protein n=1 Tax=Feldmannia species virus TaxID=39420 RepID=B5LWG3_9PHYC|nr:putative LamG-like jellyroll protein [Feldmannia species virus]ACH46826.1 putative LamG-like jellyroll protein [Feldmannia species virus]